MREQGIPPEAAERAFLLYESGLTIREVVRQIGFSYGTIQRMLNERGAALRSGREGACCVKWLNEVAFRLQADA